MSHTKIFCLKIWLALQCLQNWTLVWWHITWAIITYRGGKKQPPKLWLPVREISNLTDTLSPEWKELQPTAALKGVWAMMKWFQSKFKPQRLKSLLRERNNPTMLPICRVLLIPSFHTSLYPSCMISWPSQYKWRFPTFSNKKLWLFVIFTKNYHR